MKENETHLMPDLYEADCVESMKLPLNFGIMKCSIKNNIFFLVFAPTYYIKL